MIVIPYELTTATGSTIGKRRVCVGPDLKTASAILFKISNGGAFQVPERLVIHDDLHIMAHENLVVIVNLIIESHAVLRSSSTGASDENPQGMIRHAFISQQLLYGRRSLFT